MTTPPKYTPAPHLVDSSTLTAEDFTRYFQDFYMSLEYASVAPTLVFERLMANVVSSLPKQPSTPPSTSNKCVSCDAHIATLEEYRNEIRTLRLENKELKEKLPKAEEPPTTKILAYRNPRIGIFYNKEFGVVTAWKQISFSSPYNAPPGVIVGLREIVVGVKAATTRISAFATNIQSNGFTIHNYTNTVLPIYSTWLEVDPGDTDIQFGTFHAIEDQPYGEVRYKTTRYITFPRAYDSIPQVIAWISAFEIGNNKSQYIKVHTNGITKTGFDLHVETLQHYALLYTATASWVACTANNPNICTGIFGFHKSNNRTGFTAFRNGCFTTPPRVFLALSSFTISGGGKLNLSIRPPIVGATGITWGINNWATQPGKLISAGVSFIALG